MNRQQIDLVRTTFAMVQSVAPQAAALFYDKLFVADPTLRPLFEGSMGHQGERLMTMIGAAIGLLEEPGALLPVLRQLGARHAAYGVCERHYAVVGATLLDTLDDALGDAFTPPARARCVDCALRRRQHDDAGTRRRARLRVFDRSAVRQRRHENMSTFRTSSSTSKNIRRRA